MTERIAIPLYWDTSGYANIVIKNWQQLNEEYLSKGWEVERVDELHANSRPALIYILRKEK